MYSVLFEITVMAYSSGVKYTGESKVNVVEVDVLLDWAFAVVDVWILSGFNVTSENGKIIEPLGNPFTIGLIWTVTGRFTSFPLKYRVTSLRNIPKG